MSSSLSRNALCLIASIIVATPAFAGATSPAPVARVTPAAPLRMERHPEIRRAIASLEQAKAAMQSANHDFGGHRVDAIAACDRAIAQLRVALQYDR